MQTPFTALICDAVASRSFPDQGALRAVLERAVEEVNAHEQAVAPLALVRGDEIQGVYADLGRALRASVRARLLLRGDCELWSGIGGGALDPEEPTQSGPAWWAARDAIEEAHALQRKHRWPAGLRTRAAGELGGARGRVDALLLGLDELVAGMDERDARIALGLMDDETQGELADELEIRQPSIARRQREGGPSALFRMLQALEGE